MSFIDKEKVLLDVFITERIKTDHKGRNPTFVNWKIRYPAIYKYQFEHYIMSIKLTYTGSVVNYLKEDNIDMSNLPDNKDGELILYYNIDEAIKIIENEVERLNKQPKNTAKY